MKLFDSAIFLKKTNWTLIYDNLKPGSHLAMISDTKEYHSTAIEIENSGFEIRDMIAYICDPTILISISRKPIVETVAKNVLEFGTGGINIGISKIIPENSDQGRWPANLIHDGTMVNDFPFSKGQQGYVGPEHGDRKSINTYGDYGKRPAAKPRNDTGSAARFYFCAKTQKELLEYISNMITPPSGTIITDVLDLNFDSAHPSTLI